jgi:hypothetical protein
MDLMMKYLTAIFACRVNSVKNLSQIAIALGQDRARNELLPYILGKSVRE